MDLQKIRRLQRALIKGYIKPAGITNARVLKAFANVPRHEFVPAEYQEDAYLDMPLPIGEGQTISQPSLVAQMTQALKLKGSEKVLEIGTGSGFQAAILSKLAKKVYTVEIIESLAKNAKNVLEKLGIKNVYVHVGDGSLGLPRFAPYDAIIVTAAAPAIPEELISELKNNGRLIIPVGKSTDSQILKLVTKKDGLVKTKDIEPVMFVPLVSKNQAVKEESKINWRNNRQFDMGTQVKL